MCVSLYTLEITNHRYSRTLYGKAITLCSVIIQLRQTSLRYLLKQYFANFDINVLVNMLPILLFEMCTEPQCFFMCSKMDFNYLTVLTKF